MTVLNNTPSAGYISWSGLHIQYAGANYTIADGNTNSMYAYWTPSAPGSLQTSDAFPALTASDCLVFLNRGGMATVVPTATVVPGDLIVPGTVKADKIDVDNLFANAAFLQKLQVGSAYAGSAPPASPAVGQLWRNTGVTPNELLAWTGKGTSNVRRYAASKSGASVVIEDLSDSDNRALTATVKVVASQARSGTPSPSNIRAISGKASATVSLNGSNTTLTAAVSLYGLTGAEDEIGSDGHETHRSALKTLLGTETWLYYLANQPTDTTIARFQIEYSDLAYSPIGITSHFPFYAGPNTATTVEMACGHPSARSASNYIKKSRLSGWSDAWTDAQKISAFKVWLAAQYAAGTPVQMLYQITTPTTTTVAETRIIGTNGAITITGNGVSVTAGYTGSGWAAVGAVQRLGVESVTITPEEGLRVDTVLVSADGAHQIPTYFSARGARYGLFRSSDGAMILGGMVLPNGQPSGVAGAIVSPGSNGDSRIAIETASAGSDQARVDTAALHLVQPSFQGATDLNPAATGEKVPVWIEAVRSTYKNSNSEYMDNYNAAVKALTSMRLVAMSESGSELSWLMLQRTTEGSTIYTDGAYDGSDKARTLANFARCMRMSMPANESIAFNATARRYMLDWKTIEDNYQKYQTFKGGNASARDVGIVIQSSGYYRFVFHVDLELASSSSGAVLHVNRMPSDWMPPTTRDYCTDLDLTPSSGPTRIAYRRAASAPLSATVTTCELVADLYCSYGDKILPVVAMAAVSKTLVSEDTVFTAQRIG